MNRPKRTIDRPTRKVVLTDPFVCEIIDRHRQITGDANSARTAGRIIQIFNYMGMTIDPEAEPEKASRMVHSI